MSEHKWKIGDWCEFRGKRRLVVKVTTDGVWAVGCDVYGDAISPSKRDKDLKHLPDCTGWDWQPPKPIEPPEGYRLLAEGEVIASDDMCYAMGREWDQVCYASVGQIYSLKRFFPMARKIEPTYRPFANAEEFKGHRDRWVIIKHGSMPARVHGYSDSGILLLDANANYQTAFDRYTFEDGSPFGVIDNPSETKQ